MNKLTILLLLTGFAVHAQVPETITYQGSLNHSGSIANGLYDFEFKLFDELADGAGVQQGLTVSQQITVTDGIFSTELDFGAGVFDGFDLFLEISVKQNGSPDPYTVLSPRQSFSSVPYAHKADTVTAVTGAEVVDESLTGDDILFNSVPGTDIMVNTINSSRITNGGIFSVDLANNIISTNHIVDGTITPNDVNINQIQLRISNSCSPGASIRAITSSGSVVCEVDNVGLTSVNGSNVVDGSLTGADLSSTLNLNGTLTWNCPSGTTRVGNWCMDTNYRAVNTATGSLTDCHNSGMVLCPFEAIITCDAANVGASTSTSCRGLTDCSVNLPIRTSTPGALSPTNSVFSDLTEYRGCGNETDVVSEATGRVYYCCKPVSH